MIIFLDYEGVLHPEEVYLTKDQDAVERCCEGHKLFEHAQLLTDLLEPYPHIRIVLSTVWVFAFGFAKTRAPLPEKLQAKIKGSTWHSPMEDQERKKWRFYNRYDQIDKYVKRHCLTDWIAIETDDCDWPDSKRDRLVLTNGLGGIGDMSAQKELIAKIQAKLRSDLPTQVTTQ